MFVALVLLTSTPASVIEQSQRLAFNITTLDVMCNISDVTQRDLIQVTLVTSHIVTSIAWRPRNTFVHGLVGLTVL